MVHAGVAIAKITDEDDSETEQLMEEFQPERSLKIMTDSDVRIMEVCGTHT